MDARRFRSIVETAQSQLGMTAPCRRAGRLLCLPRLAVGVAPVAFGLASGLVLDHARNAAPISGLACLGFGSCSGCDGGLALCRLGLQTLALLCLRPLATSAPFLAGRSDCLTLGLAGELGRFCGFLCRAVGFKKRFLRIGSGAATVGEFTVSDVSQVSLPVEASR